MSKAAAKDKAPEAPVYRLGEDEQVELLAQALLREYMHRKQFKRTLAAFDAEHPRDERTVSSRAVMYDLMHLAHVMPGMKERGIETIMEALCCMRFEAASPESSGQAEVQRAVAQLEAESASLEQRIAEYEAETRRLVSEAEESAAAAKKKKKKAKSTAEGGDAADKDAASKKSKKEKGAKEKSAKKTKGKEAASGGAKPFSIDDLLDNDDDLEAARRQQEARSRVTRSEDNSNAATAETTPTHPNATGNARPAHNESSPSSSSAEGSEGDDDYDAAIRKIREEEARALQRTAATGSVSFDGDGKPKAKRGWGGDFDVSATDASAGPSAGSKSPATQRRDAPTSASQSTVTASEVRASQPDELGEAVGHQLLECLVGPKRLLPSSFQKQGFYPNPAPGTPAYGLEQREGGPCGVLAVVQARLIQHYHAPQGAFRGAFEGSLVRALTQTLALACGSKRAATIVRPPDGTGGAPSSLKAQRAWLSQFRVLQVPSREADLEAAVRSVLPEWSEPDGPGLLCLVLSLILSRGGADAVMRDMDHPASLIVEHGYCSQEVTNLALAGRATSNAHDGIVEAGGMQLKGYEEPLSVGFLSMLEAKGMMVVGSLAKYPSGNLTGITVWVLYNESHYSVLFSKATGAKALKPRSALGDPDAKFDGFGSETKTTRDGPDVPCTDLWYYDQQGQQTQEIRLTVTVPKMPLPAQRQDRLVSFVDQVIRTVSDWREARVNWNGTEPLL
jgi:hypothetical protein